MAFTFVFISMNEPLLLLISDKLRGQSTPLAGHFPLKAKYWHHAPLISIVFVTPWDCLPFTTKLWVPQGGSMVELN